MLPKRKRKQKKWDDYYYEKNEVKNINLKKVKLLDLKCYEKLEDTECFADKIQYPILKEDIDDSLNKMINDIIAANIKQLRFKLNILMNNINNLNHVLGSNYIYLQNLQQKCNLLRNNYSSEYEILKYENLIHNSKQFILECRHNYENLKIEHAKKINEINRISKLSINDFDYVNLLLAYIQKIDDLI